jgi:putative transcriptional regulator
MTIAHHPPEELLAAFAAGKLDEGEHLVVAVHTSQCPACRRFLRAVEAVGGAAVEAAEPAVMSKRSFEAVIAKIERAPQKTPAAQATPRAVDDDGLPEILRHYRIGRRKRIAPGISLRPIELPGNGKSRAFLLKSGPGTRMLEHTHSGIELTCVLKGSFSHVGGRFGPGDFDFGDESLDHQPLVGDGEPCLCLVAMTGDLRMNGFFGRLISPFVRL